MKKAIFVIAILFTAAALLTPFTARADDLSAFADAVIPTCGVTVVGGVLATAITRGRDHGNSAKAGALICGGAVVTAGTMSGLDAAYNALVPTENQLAAPDEQSEN